MQKRVLRPFPFAALSVSVTHRTVSFPTPAVSNAAMKRFDPRLYQIGALTLLLLYGVTALDFDLTVARSVAITGTAIAAQAICSRIWHLRFDPRSAAISGLSLSLLLRSNSIILLMTAAIAAVASKFVIRWRGKHIFNPTNFAIVAMMLVTPHVWVSPGQWGNVAFFGFLITCLGGLVVNRAARSDVTYAFIAAWSAILIGRSLWLGEPMAIPLHRLENGALLLFTFFMISDPKTTPDSRAGRILFAAIVALGAAYVQFKLFRTNGILWSLFFSSLLVPLLDLLLRAERYSWGLAFSRSGGLVVVDNRETARLRDIETSEGGLSCPAA
jgi:Na+-transporting NADH:ubiquinone oxidoreductase subunit NqrB